MQYLDATLIFVFGSRGSQIEGSEAGVCVNRPP